MSKIPKGKWFCPECNLANKPELQESLKILNQALINENKEIIPVRGDGNCMFRALALVKYNDEKMHFIIRKEISNGLIELINNDYYKHFWDSKFWDCEANQNLCYSDSSANLIYSIVMLKVGNYDFDGSICSRSVKAWLREYAIQLKIPALPYHGSKVLKNKYGNDLDQWSYACFNKVDVWNLQKCDKFYMWTLACPCFKKRLKDSIEVDFCALFFEFIGSQSMSNHYKTIVTKENSRKIHPNVSVKYSLTGKIEILQPVKIPSFSSTK